VLGDDWEAVEVLVREDHEDRDFERITVADMPTAWSRIQRLQARRTALQGRSFATAWAA
jgi:hypothetical protein